MASTRISKKLQRAISLHQSGEFVQAKTLYQQILHANPNHAEACHLTGLIECTQGNTEPGETLIRRAIKLDHKAIHFKANLAAVLVEKKQLTEAEDLCRQVLRVDSKHTKALANLGTVLRQQQRRSEAQEVFEQAVEAERNASALCNLATVLTDLGQFEEAKTLLLEARELNGQLPEVHRNLAIVLRELGQANAAMHSLAVAEVMTPNNDQMHLTRANLLLDNGQPVEAAAHYQAALGHDPQSADAVFGLGCALMQTGAWEVAFEACRLATVLQPDNNRLASGMLYAATLSPLIRSADVTRLHREWGARIEAATSVERLQSDLSVDRPLRIGYVSPDFHGHATMSFLYPLLQAHDRSKFQLVLYSQTVREDATTRLVQNLGDEWCCTRPLSDQQLVDRIKADRIDILIDVAGHTADNRLPVFARKPAPVQVSFLGYPTTTGLIRIDYYLTDAVREQQTPADAYSERMVFLPHGAACFRAPHTTNVAPPPCTRNGYITLGSTHRTEKISTAALHTWAQVLDALPEARLLMFRNTFKSDALRAGMTQRLRDAGVDMSRVDFAWDLPEQHHDVYSRFDVLLDVFPWSSGTVAYDAMWMGVPIPTLAGDCGSCRGTASLLHHCGFPELVANSPDEYVLTVQELAKDRSRLNALRTEIRPAMQKTVCNADRFARDVEAAFHGFWQTYAQPATGC